ncbi:lysophospholipase Plb1 [Talaromyces proteolyticus]|uniref:Lysophospholipase n=1 Tax=Talaromyces proteolyticus TaxID=1131652 RepID=A0AAD4KVX9_9EURO|nr:lysophospholipase Plb1 [Talaromyces proteolyticus]KAH8700217.1 lysophospholipase Plb1 [Talaromyces proteolyticus]
MHSLSSIVLVAGLLSGTIASSAHPDAVVPRAYPNAPDGYAPENVTCPENRPTIRSAAKLSANESSWLPLRRNNTVQAMKDFFGHVNISNFDAAGYINKVSGSATDLPNIAIAVSGGGYRAMLTGAGAVKAFDSRTSNSTSSGQLGGLLQSATYIAGLSGGSWLMASIFVNNFTTIDALQADTTGQAWQLDQSIVEGPKGMSTLSYYNTIADQVHAKSKAGYNITITDIWARMLSFQFINATDGGPSYTWSSLALDPNFVKGNTPMPLVVADLRNPGETIIGSNSTILEFSPWEFGSWDPTVYAFAPLQYLGSRFNGGVIPQGVSCVRGFDNAGFTFGTSSSLFNEFLTEYNISSLPSVAAGLLTGLAKDLGKNDEDIASYINPFYNYTANDGIFANDKNLNVVDGGLDLQNIPLYPLIQPERNVDVIFAVDASADTDNHWPNGTSLVNTYERSLNTSGIANGTSFPAVPDQNTFVNLGLNTRPTFFGCNSSNTTHPTPLVVYLPNYPYIMDSNKSTFDLQYNTSDRDNMILNSYDMVTMANSTRDKNWSTCVGCAMLSRSFERTNTTVPDVCNSCFKTYCWDGTRNSTTPVAYAPSFNSTTVNAGLLSSQPSASLVLTLSVAAIFLSL